MIKDEELAKYIFEKCKNSLPLAYEGGLIHSLYNGFTVLKYDTEGGKFTKHYDNNYSPD